MRTTLLLLATTLLALLAWLFVRTGVGAPPAPALIGAKEAPDEGTEGGVSKPIPALDQPMAVGTAAAADASREVASSNRPDIEWDRQQILGCLVAKTSRQPVSDYSILVVPSGQDPGDAGVLPPHQRATTDLDGLFAFEGLHEPGPWDVYAFPADLGHEPTEARRSARVGSVTARNAVDAERTTFQITMGPIVTLESPLPEGIEPADVWFELIDGASRSATGSQGQGATHSRDRRFARGRGTEDGKTIADLPWPRGMQFGEAVVVRVVTADGLFGLLSAHETVGLAPWRIDAPLEPRGKIRVHLTIEDPRSETPTEADWADAISVVPWRLLDDDPSRSQPGLMVSGRTIRWNRRWRRTDTATYELHDLPLSTAIEIGPWGEHAAAEWMAGGLYPDTIAQTRAVHGNPEPVEVRVRRLR